MNKAIVLLSGGLDSATTLFYAQAKGFSPHCLIFDYGQRHRKEIVAAKRIARVAKSPYTILKIQFPWKGSALLDKRTHIPSHRNLKNTNIPSTYVPARNIIFLSFAASYAETIGAKQIFIGANAVDYSGYPDCRPVFIKAFQRMLGQGLKMGVQGKGLNVSTPLIHKSKAQIINLARRLGVPLDLTWSCYQGGRLPCGVCDSCRLRAQGFQDARASR